MAMHWLITFIRLLFSKAAATRSLSANCLFTATSDVCVPGVISTVTLKRGGNDLNSFTLIDSPIRVAMLQCGIVGVKLTNTSLFLLSTFMRLGCTTCNSSNVNGCSGSLISRIKSIRIKEEEKKCIAKSFYYWIELKFHTKYFTFIEWIVNFVIPIGCNTFSVIWFLINIWI